MKKKLSPGVLTIYCLWIRLYDLRLTTVVPRVPSTYPCIHGHVEGKRSRGRQRKTWMDNVREDLKQKNIDLTRISEATRNREIWRSLVRASSSARWWKREKKKKFLVIFIDDLKDGHGRLIVWISSLCQWWKIKVNDLMKLNGGGGWMKNHCLMYFR